MLKVSSTCAVYFLLFIFLNCTLFANSEQENDIIPRNYDEYVPQNEAELWQFLQADGAGPERVDKVFSDGTTPLIIAAKVGSVALTKQLLKQGANPMKFYVDHQLRERHFRRKKVSSDNHAQAIRHHRKEKVFGAKSSRRKSLPDAHLATIHQPKERTGSLPIHFAAFFNHAQVIEVLLRAGPTDQIYIRDKDGNNSVHCAVTGKKVEAFLVLMKGPRRGATLYANALKKALNAKNNQRITPMHALIEGLPEEDPNFFESLDREEQITQALIKLKLMIEKGGDINLPSRKKSLYELAREKNIPRISAFLAGKRAIMKNPGAEIRALHQYIGAPEEQFFDYLQIHARRNVSEEELLNRFLSKPLEPPKKSILDIFSRTKKKAE